MSNYSQEYMAHIYEQYNMSPSPEVGFLLRRIEELEKGLRRIGDPTEIVGMGQPETFAPSAAKEELYARMRMARRALGGEDG